MEEKIIEMGKNLADVRLRESLLKGKLQVEQAKNMRLKGKLQQKDTQLATIENICMDAM